MASKKRDDARVRAGTIAPAAIQQGLRNALQLREAGRHDQAAAICQQVLAAQPGNFDAIFLAGILANDLEDHDRAVRLLSKTVKARPKFADGYRHLGVAFGRKGNLVKAVSCYRKAISLDPRNGAYRFNLGNAYRDLGRPHDAISCYREALARDAEFADALINLGYVLHDTGAYAESLAVFERLLAIRPDDIPTYRNVCKLELLLGRFEEGWRKYLNRPSMDDAPAALFRELLAEDLSGQRILVGREQGLGDEIFFLRFLPRLTDRGAIVSYLPDPRLAAMLDRAGVAEIVNEEGHDYDLKLSVGDLPYVLGTTDDTEIPPTISLEPLPERSKAFSRRLATFGPPPYIAVTWRAGVINEVKQHYREITMNRLADILKPLDAGIVAIQRLPQTGEVAALEAALGRSVLDLTAHNSDLEDMLALMGLFDDYVCVDNTNVHLRTARDRGSRVLVPHPIEFRWMTEGRHSPWFEASTAYRQSPDGDWSAALAELKRDLETAWSAT